MRKLEAGMSADVPRNCMKANLNAHHPLGECRTKLVPLCQSCWRELIVCARNPNILPAIRCKVCSEQYARCLGPFFH